MPFRLWRRTLRNTLERMRPFGYIAGIRAPETKILMSLSAQVRIAWGPQYFQNTTNLGPSPSPVNLRPEPPPLMPLRRSSKEVTGDSLLLRNHRNEFDWFVAEIFSCVSLC